MRSSMDDLFDQLYLKAINENISRKDLHEYILAGLREAFPNAWGLVDFVERKITRVAKNLGARKKRFRRKAFLNPWNYFVTITYDDELQSEESFGPG